VCSFRHTGNPNQVFHLGTKTHTRQEETRDRTREKKKRERTRERERERERARGREQARERENKKKQNENGIQGDGAQVRCRLEAHVVQRPSHLGTQQQKHEAGATPITASFPVKNFTIKNLSGLNLKFAKMRNFSSPLKLRICIEGLGPLPIFL